MADEAQTPPTDTQTPPLNAEGGAWQAPQSGDIAGQASEPVTPPAAEPVPSPEAAAPAPEPTPTETTAPEPTQTGTENSPAPLPPPRPEDGTPLLGQEGKEAKIRIQCPS